MSVAMLRSAAASSTVADDDGAITVASDRCPDMPIAELLTIRLDLLQSGHEPEHEKLFAACQNDGVFYLDLQHAGAELKKTLEGMHRLNRDLFLRLSDAEKVYYDADKISNIGRYGYKPVGRNYGGIEGKKDGFETYTIPKNGIMGLGDDARLFVQPPIVDQHMDLLRAFTAAMNHATMTILSSLSRSLGLPEGETLQDYHRLNVPSPDIVRLLKYHKQAMHERGAPHTPHTDLGTLTFLFTGQPGLQVLAPHADRWTYVDPRPECAVVNLGDGISLLSNKLFHSCLHRVGPLPDRPMETRYSFAYLVRAEDSTPMTSLKSDLIPAPKSDVKVFTSAEWLRRKFEVLRLRTHDEKENWVLTGQKKALPR